MQTLAQMRERDRLAATAKGPTGIGGWLLLPLLGMALSPIFMAWSLPETLSVLGDGYVLTTQQSFAVRFELVNSLLIGGVAPIGLLILFFKRKRQFPQVYIAWLVINLIVTLMIYGLTYNAFRDYFESPGVTFWDETTSRNLGQTVFGAVLWTAYMLNSARVRNTFVK